VNSIVKNLLNPVKIIRALIFQKRQKKFQKSKSDLELMLYSRILKNDMLHYGYFEDTETMPEDIAINDFENAQAKYCEILLNKITNKDEPILDVGCGMGGLAAFLTQHGCTVDVLTPNEKQIEYIRNKHGNLLYYDTKYEDLVCDRKYGTVINAESLCYINLEKAFLKTEALLNPEGQWIISDFFSGNNDRTGKKQGISWDGFLLKVKEHNLELVSQQDITGNILPLLKLLDLYVKRLANPLVDYLENKLLGKRPWLYYITAEYRVSAKKKMEKETAKIDPEKFIKDQRYMLVVLKKPGR